MDQRPRAGRYLELLLFTLSAVLLYRTRIGVFFFLIPLQIVASRKGLPALLAAEGIFVAAAAGIQAMTFLFPGAAPEPLVLVAVEAIVVALFLLGLVIANLSPKGLPRAQHRLVATALMAGAAAVPTVLWLSGNAEFQSAMGEQYKALAAALSAVSPAGDVVASSILSSLLEPERLRSLAEAIFLRSLAVSYLGLLAFCWWAGRAIAGRAAVIFGAPPRFSFAAFRLESWWLWPLIGAGALVLLDLFSGLGQWAYPVWNAVLIVLFLYGLQGMAILRFLFEKYRLPRLLWPLAIIVGGSLVFRGSPTAAAVILLLIPVFGVSENWIRYRVPRSPEPTEQS